MKAISGRLKRLEATHRNYRQPEPPPPAQLTPEEAGRVFDILAAAGGAALVDEVLQWQNKKCLLSKS